MKTCALTDVDRQRVEFLFAPNERSTAPLLPVEKKGRRRG
jgi:hypothetical protein